MTICSQCHAHFHEYAVLAKDDPEAMAAEVMSSMIAGYKAIATGSTEGVTNRQLFEAAVGTLSMVAKEVPELQAAKIRGAIDALLACTT
jgi:hypothetical protein